MHKDTWNKWKPTKYKYPNASQDAKVTFNGVMKYPRESVNLQRFLKLKIIITLYYYTDKLKPVGD